MMNSATNQRRSVKKQQLIQTSYAVYCHPDKLLSGGLGSLITHLYTNSVTFLLGHAVKWHLKKHINSPKYIMATRE